MVWGVLCVTGRGCQQRLVRKHMFPTDAGPPPTTARPGQPVLGPAKLSAPHSVSRAQWQPPQCM